jgi:putative hydrolase of the HAD superfamily
MTRIRGILLDAVGTLIDPDPPVSVAYAQAASRQGVELDVSVVHHRFRRAFRMSEAEDLRGPLATDEEGEIRRWRWIVHQVLPELPDLERGFVELWDHFARPESWRLFPDVGPTLEHLQEAGLPVRIASNFDGRLRAIVLGFPELSPWSDALVVSSEVGWRKPHPRFYLTACERLRLAPAEVLCLGDDPENDLQGPRRVGMPAVLIDRDGDVSGDLPRLSSLTELVAYLGSRSLSA